MSIDRYYTLGRSGLRVSRLALGTMTFGTEWGWGADEASARQLFDAYLDAGGNLVDTADLYTNGTSETWLGRFVADRGVRDRVVLATKFSYNAEAGNPNAGGNGRKNQIRALGVMVWSPLGSGLSLGPPSDRNWTIVAELESVAKELGMPMAAVALNWIAHRPAVASVIVGATSMTQLQTNLEALTFTIPEELSSRLEQVSQPDRHFAYTFFGPEIQGMMHGGKPVGNKPAGYSPDVLIEGSGAGVE